MKKRQGPVRPYTPSDLASVHELYESIVTGRVPHGWPVPREQLAETLLSPTCVGSRNRLLSEQAVLVDDEA